MKRRKQDEIKKIMKEHNAQLASIIGDLVRSRAMAPARPHENTNFLDQLTTAVANVAPKRKRRLSKSQADALAAGRQKLAQMRAGKKE